MKHFLKKALTYFLISMMGWQNHVAFAVTICLESSALIAYQHENKQIYLHPFSFKEDTPLDVTFHESLCSFEGHIVLLDETSHTVILEALINDPSSPQHIQITSNHSFALTLSSWMDHLPILIKTEKDLHLTTINPLNSLGIWARELTLYSDTTVNNHFLVHVHQWQNHVKVRANFMELKGIIQNKGELISYGTLFQDEGELILLRGSRLFSEKGLFFKGRLFKIEGASLHLPSGGCIQGDTLKFGDQTSIQGLFLESLAKIDLKISPKASFHMKGGIFRSKGRIRNKGQFSLGTFLENPYNYFYINSSAEHLRSLLRINTPFNGLFFQAQTIIDEARIISREHLIYKGDEINLKTRLYGSGSANVMLKGLHGTIKGRFSDVNVVNTFFEKILICDMPTFSASMISLQSPTLKVSGKIDSKLYISGTQIEMDNLSLTSATLLIDKDATTRMNESTLKVGELFDYGQNTTLIETKITAKNSGFQGDVALDTGSITAEKMETNASFRADHQSTVDIDEIQHAGSDFESFGTFNTKKALIKSKDKITFDGKIKADQMILLAKKHILSGKISIQNLGIAKNPIQKNFITNQKSQTLDGYESAENVMIQKGTHIQINNLSVKAKDLSFKTHAVNIAQLNVSLETLSLKGGNLGSIQGTVDHFQNEGLLNVSKNSYLIIQEMKNTHTIGLQHTLSLHFDEAPVTIENMGHINGDGEIEVFSDQNFERVEDFLMGRTSVQPQGGIGLHVHNQEVVLENNNTVSHKIHLHAKDIRINQDQNYEKGVLLKADETLTARKVSMHSDTSLMLEAKNCNVTKSILQTPDLSVVVENKLTAHGASFISKKSAKNQKVQQTISAGEYQANSLISNGVLTHRVIHDAEGPLSIEGRDLFHQSGGFNRGESVYIYSAHKHEIISATDQHQRFEWQSGHGNGYFYTNFKNITEQNVARPEIIATGMDRRDNEGQLLSPSIMIRSDGDSLFESHFIKAQPFQTVILSAENSLQQTCATESRTEHWAYDTYCTDGGDYHNHWSGTNHTSNDIENRIEANYAILDAKTRQSQGLEIINAMRVVDRCQHSYDSTLRGTSHNRETVQMSSSGSNIFGLGDSSVTQTSEMRSAYSIPTVQQANLWIEEVRDPSLPSSSTFEGPMVRLTNASHIKRPQKFKSRIKETNIHVHTYTDGTSFRPAPFSMPCFKGGTIQQIKGLNQTLGYISKGVQLARNFQLAASGNPNMLIWQVIGELTHLDFTESESIFDYHQQTEEAPFVNYGRVFFDGDSLDLEGTVQYVGIENPVGNLSKISLNAPLDHIKSSYRQTQRSTSVSLTSIGKNGSIYITNEMINESLPSFFAITGDRARFTIDELNLDGTLFKRILPVAQRQISHQEEEENNFIEDSSSRADDFETYMDQIAPLADPSEGFIQIHNARIRAPWHERKFSSHTKSWGISVNVLSMVQGYMMGGVVGALMMATSVSGSYVNNRSHSYDYFFESVDLRGSGSHLTIDNLETEGNCFYLGDAKVTNHHHIQSASIQSASRSESQWTDILEVSQGLIGIYSSLTSIQHNIKEINDHNTNNSKQKPFENQKKDRDNQPDAPSLVEQLYTQEEDRDILDFLLFPKIIEEDSSGNIKGNFKDSMEPSLSIINDLFKNEEDLSDPMMRAWGDIKEASLSQKQVVPETGRISPSIVYQNLIQEFDEKVEIERRDKNYWKMWDAFCKKSCYEEMLENRNDIKAGHKTCTLMKNASIHFGHHIWHEITHDPVSLILEGLVTSKIKMIRWSALGLLGLWHGYEGLPNVLDTIRNMNTSSKVGMFRKAYNSFKESSPDLYDIGEHGALLLVALNPSVKNLMISGLLIGGSSYMKTNDIEHALHRMEELGLVWGAHHFAHRSQHHMVHKIDHKVHDTITPNTPIYVRTEDVPSIFSNKIKSEKLTDGTKINPVYDSSVFPLRPYQQQVDIIKGNPPNAFKNQRVYRGGDPKIVRFEKRTQNDVVRFPQKQKPTAHNPEKLFTQSSRTERPIIIPLPTRQNKTIQTFPIGHNAEIFPFPPLK